MCSIMIRSLAMSAAVTSERSCFCLTGRFAELHAMIALPASCNSVPRKENSPSCERDDKITPVISRALHLRYNGEHGC